MSYIANTPAQQRVMLDACGVRSIEDLFTDIPEALWPKSFDIPDGLSELEVLAEMGRLASRNNADLTCFAGAGFYDHFIPSAVSALAGRSEFYTAYTPYQPEVSQGTLQAVYEYQSHICRLTGLHVSNASVYDGGTGLYEGCNMALSATGRKILLVDAGVSPIYRCMLATYTSNLNVEIVTVETADGKVDRARMQELLTDQVAAVVVQNPNFFGIIDDHSDLAAAVHAKGALLIQSFYPIAAAILKTPGAMGVDIATAEGQSLGIPLSFGGPYVGIIAAAEPWIRRMPGRIVGRTVDQNGREAFVLTLQAREQHIRREKATSNICTNQALCAMRAHIFLSMMGKQGLREMAQLCHAKAQYARERLAAVRGVRLKFNAPTFNEFVIELPTDAGTIAKAMMDKGILPGIPLDKHYPGMNRCLLVAVTEKRTRADIDRYAQTLEAVL